MHRAQNQISPRAAAINPHARFITHPILDKVLDHAGCVGDVDDAPVPRESFAVGAPETDRAGVIYCGDGVAAGCVELGFEVEGGGRGAVWAAVDVEEDGW